MEASNGASDYGNKFGEPVLAGFARSFGMLLNKERREWIKPIMFSGGIGSIDSRHVSKHPPEKGLLSVLPYIIVLFVLSYYLLAHPRPEWTTGWTCMKSIYARGE